VSMLLLAALIGCIVIAIKPAKKADPKPLESNELRSRAENDTLTIENKTVA